MNSISSSSSPQTSISSCSSSVKGILKPQGQPKKSKACKKLRFSETVLFSPPSQVSIKELKESAYLHKIISKKSMAQTRLSALTQSRNRSMSEQGNNADGQPLVNHSIIKALELTKKELAKTERKLKEFLHKYHSINKTEEESDTSNESDSENSSNSHNNGKKEHEST